MKPEKKIICRADVYYTLGEVVDILKKEKKIAKI